MCFQTPRRRSQHREMISPISGKKCRRKQCASRWSPAMCYFFRLDGGTQCGVRRQVFLFRCGSRWSLVDISVPRSITCAYDHQLRGLTIKYKIMMIADRVSVQHLSDRVVPRVEDHCLVLGTIVRRSTKPQPSTVVSHSFF
jgi:hypothetical protein